MCANPDWLFGLINREDRFNSTCDIATNNVYKDLNGTITNCLVDSLNSSKQYQ
jgi:hypothetical protein